MSIAATCASIAAALASAQGGETIELRGDCPRLVVASEFRQPVTVDATKARVKGLVVTGGGLWWKGGTITAPGGIDGAGPNGYGVKITGRNVTLDGVTVTDAVKGIVLDGADGVTITGSRLWRLRDDGINASQSVNLKILHNVFSETDPFPSVCTQPDGTREERVSRRDCKGKWRDGNHADAVQMRNGVADAELAYNKVYGNTQGLAQMAGRGDAPLARVKIHHNFVQTSLSHQITLGDCTECRIFSNNVVQASNSRYKAVIRAGTAARCGNEVPDERPDGPCE